MAERPSTSDGPGARDLGGNPFLIGNKNFIKRVSRDDSFLNTKAYAGAGFKSHRHTRARQAAPELSPQSTSASGNLVVPTIKMPTFEEGGEIGMALGSPGQAANWHTWDSQSAQQMKQTVSPTPSKGNGSKSSEAPAPKKQPGKWKLFGMFGRKHSDQSTTNVPVSGSNEPRGSDPGGTPQSRPATKLERSHTSASRKMPKHKPLMARTNTVPFAEDVAMEHQPKVPASRPEGDRSFGNIPITLGSVPSVERGFLPPSKGPAANGPMLNVEIPTVELERYSVMFSSVLDKPSSSSNLLARRQATLQQLRNLDDAREQEQGSKQSERFRRASSPQPGISPTFDQFPTPPSSQDTHKVPNRLLPHVKGGLARSNTSPAMLHSPLRHRFDAEQPSPDDKRSSYNHLRDPAQGNPKGKLTIATLAKKREQFSAPKPHRFDPEVSSLILESPTDSDTDPGDGKSDVKSPELIQPDPFRGQVQQVPEPKWEIINPASSASQQAPSTASSSVSSQKEFPSSSASSAKTNTTLPSAQSSVHDDSDRSHVDPDNEEDDAVDDDILITKDMSPVEASIARQISISRQQRKMLRPLHTGRSNPRLRDTPSRSGMNAAATIAGVAKSPSKQSPVQVTLIPKITMAETKSSTPTLIASEVRLDAQLPQNRKSERVVLEAA